MCNRRLAVLSALLLTIASLFCQPAAADITTGLLAYYTANDTPNDASGNAKHGTLENGATYRDGQAGLGRAFEFDGTDDQGLLPGDLGSDGAGAFTIAFRKYTDTVADFEMFASKYAAATNRLEICHGGAGVGDFGNNDVQVFMTVSSTAYYTGTTGNLLSTGSWQHIAWVFDGAGVGNDGRSKIYVNGALATATHSGTWPAATYSNSGVATYLGRRGGGASLPMDGGLDDVRFYNRALSAGDITELYNFRSGSLLLMNARNNMRAGRQK